MTRGRQYEINWAGLIILAVIALAFGAIAYRSKQVEPSQDKVRWERPEYVPGLPRQIQDEIHDLIATQLEEAAHLQRVANATGEERDQLVKALEDETPEDEFARVWLIINGYDRFDAWGPDGFTPIPGLNREALILSATNYGISDIENGGLDQFFHNGTGTFAPEMVECFQGMGLEAAAQLLGEAMRRMGEPYPRSREARWEKLEAFYQSRKDDERMFEGLDFEFYDSLTVGGRSYESRSKQWLEERCGVTRLSDRATGGS